MLAGVLFVPGGVLVILRGAFNGERIPKGEVEGGEEEEERTELASGTPHHTSPSAKEDETEEAEDDKSVITPWLVRGVGGVVRPVWDKAFGGRLEHTCARCPARRRCDARARCVLAWQWG